MMKHPKRSDLLEYGRELLPPELRHDIEEHLEICETCRREVGEVSALTEKLRIWEDVEVPDEYVDAQLRLLERRLSDAGAQRITFPKNVPLLSRANLRGAIIAATAVLSTIAVQGLILHPLSVQREIRTVFEMAPLPLSYPSAGALPDTMIVPFPRTKCL